MKFIILFIISYMVLTEAVEINLVSDIEARRDPCPTRMKCELIRIACPRGTVFDMNRRGCCCRPLCTGQNEVYTCGCADKVCNEYLTECVRCIDGCFCKPEFVRHPTTRKCISEQLCPLDKLQKK